MKPVNFRWVIIGDLMIGYGTPGSVDVDVWNEYVNDLETKPINRYLGATVGAFSVNSVQRKASADAAKKKKLAVAIVTDDRLVKGLVTAVSWMGAEIRAFSWRDIDSAFGYLKVTGPMLLKSKEALKELEAAAAAGAKESSEKR